MKYLLDVNALIAWWHSTHSHHIQFHQWGKAVGFKNLHTCNISELGFLRVSMQVYQFTAKEAQTALENIRARSAGHLDTVTAPALPAWAKTPAATTDAYLCQLARHHKLRLATFDTRIQDAAAEVIS